MSEPVAYFNGRWIPASAVAIPPSDAGFVLGVTVAEQIRTFGGKIFRLDDHIARLFHSLEIVGVDPEMTREAFSEAAQEIVARNHPLLAEGDDLGLSIFVTPGGYPAYGPPGPRRPTVCLHTYRLPFHLWAEKYLRGQHLATTEIEQVSPRCWPPTLKCRSRMHYWLADRRAATSDPEARALLLDADGFVSEASTANLLIYNAAEGLISPPSSKILHGISLAVAVELARSLGIAFVERDLTVEDVATAQEVLLTSTPMCMLPVTRFNGRPIGDGRPGNVFERIMAAWSDRVGIDIIAQSRRFDLTS